MTSLLYTPDAMSAPTTWPPAEGLALPTKYELDPFQKHAVLGIHAGNHVFVTAKTGSGKTFVGEYLIADALRKGKRVFYTTPIKSLSNQKYHDLKKLFPHATVGILTGDIKMCPDAQIVVMTAEILRNLFYKRGTATEGVGLTAAISLTDVVGIVMDEVHYIQDPDRGHVWEESLILCPRDLQLVLLSATMPSAASLAGWLAELHQRRTVLLSTTYRIVPLLHGILGAASATSATRTVTTMMDNRGNWNPEGYNSWLRDRKTIADGAAAHRKSVEARRRDGYSAPPPAAKVRVEDPSARLERTVGWLRDHGALPALFFVFSRRECERLAGSMKGSFLDTSDGAAAAHIVDFHLSRYRATLEKSPQYHQIRDLLIRGIAFHHSGLQPLLKEIVEILFTRGLVRLLFATETFSVGLNMPTKTVVFLELEKFSDGGQKRLLRPDEYIQMAGRAGRRGLDTQGLVLYEPMRDPITNEELRGLLCGALPPLESRMRFHYDFLLRRLAAGSSSAAAGAAAPPQIAEQSYWAACQKEARTLRGTEYTDLAKIVAKESAKFSTEDRDAYTTWFTMKSTVESSKNATQKKAQLALKRWEDENRGIHWENLKGQMSAFLGLEKKAAGLAAELEAWDAAPLLQVAPLESCLTAWGFLDAGGLTPLGLIATEVNEGHGILMPMLAVSGEMDAMTAEETACILAGFLREGGGGDEGPTLGDSGLRREAIEVLHWIDRKSQQCSADESRAAAGSPTGFWDLSALWVCVAARWIAGAGLTEIATEFGLFEGNVQRGLLRIANLLDEWSALCELRRDLPALEKVRGLRFLRDEVVVDSLYLRL